MSKSIRDILFDEVLPRVAKPGQYAGGERNAIVKDHASVDLKVALAFHDTYAIGMSHLGLRILYHLINERARRVRGARVRTVDRHGSRTAPA